MANQAFEASWHGRSSPNAPPTSASNMSKADQSIPVRGVPHLDLVQQAILQVNRTLGSDPTDKLALDQPSPEAVPQAGLLNAVSSTRHKPEETCSAWQLQRHPVVLSVKQNAYTASNLEATPESDDATLVPTNSASRQQVKGAVSGSKAVSEHIDTSAPSSGHPGQSVGDSAGKSLGQLAETVVEQGRPGKKEALSQLIARAKKLKGQLDAHARRSAPR